MADESVSGTEPACVASEAFGYQVRNTCKRWLARILPRALIEGVRIHRTTQPTASRTCPCCGYRGLFGAYGSPPRIDARCVRCGSLERHRLFYLAYREGRIGGEHGLAAPVVHFAPEAVVERLLRAEFPDYRTADLYETADMRLDLERIALSDASVGTVIGNHVLEHVDDLAAAREVRRILRPGGHFVTSAPIIEGWERTYENAAITSESDRILHFGQKDHVRFYGRDFRSRIETSGLVLETEITAEGEDVVEFSLLRGEKVFVFQNPA